MKKLLSVLLVAVLLVSSFSVLSYAADAPALSYTVTGTCAVDGKTGVQKNLFNVEVTIDSSKINALDGESAAYTYEVDSIVANGIDYMTDEDAFFAAFEAEDYAGTLLEVTFTIDFESDKVFGTLDYTVNVTGFMAPPSVGLGPVDDILAGVALPVETTFSDNIWQFPSVDEIEIIKAPTKQYYKDTEKFELDGTKLAVKTKVPTGYTEVPDATGAIKRVYTYEEGYTGIIEYSDSTANMFSTNPTKDERLNVNVQEVVAFFDGIQIAKLPVRVEHNWGSGYSNITTDKWTEGKPGYHAIICGGCGEAHDAQPHAFVPVLDENGEPLIDEDGNEVYWTFNNDQSFFADGTESATCGDCGAVVIRDKIGSSDANGIFGGIEFFSTIINLINTVLRLIASF